MRRRRGSRPDPSGNPLAWSGVVLPRRSFAAVDLTKARKSDSMTTTYDFAATAADGSQVPLADYEGKVLLIVNVASKCGLTPQYEGLESLYRDDKDRGLEILGLPLQPVQGAGAGQRRRDPSLLQDDLRRHLSGVRQNRRQRPGRRPSLSSTCARRRPETSVPQYGDFYKAISNIRPEAEGTDEVKWNFTKFLVDRDGAVIKRYEPPVSPADIKADLEQYL